MLHNADWERSKKRFNALWENEIIDRCTVSIRIPKDNADNEFKKVPDNKEEAFDYWNNKEEIFNRYNEHFNNTFFLGDAFPCIFNNFGTAGHAKYIADSKYEYRDTVWFHPTITDWDNELVFNKKTFDSELEIAEYLSKRSNGDYLIGNNDNCGNIDALAHLRGNDYLLMDFIINPDKVKSAIQRMDEILRYSNQRFYQTVKKCNEGGSAHSWMQLWSEDRLIQLQVDFSVMISNEMFVEFCLPELEATCSWIDKAIYHLDGAEQIRHLDSILSIKDLNMIQWTPVEGQPPTSDFIHVLQKIQKNGKGLVLLPFAWEVEKLLLNLSPKGLHFADIRGLKSEKEASDLFDLINKLSRPKKEIFY